ncbi:MAG TPA: molybdate ABC transporter substrate-binding protein [Gemmataceae bacterium]|jgi:molybdate transport system regulatory protein|nr:molybdate ABC transporter substrate-binding protein [Gemmataceae bacterium]
MADEMLTSADGWTVGVRVWAERHGQAVLGPGGLELLEHLNRLGSISAAARQMGMSYRKAWSLVQTMNAAATSPIVALATGGTGGGGATLTPLGRNLVHVVRSLNARLAQTAAEVVRQALPHALHLLAAVSLEEVVGRLLSDYARLHPDVRVRTVFGASDELADLIRGGAPADLFLSASPDHVNRLGRAPARRGPLAENALAVITPVSHRSLTGRLSTLLRRSEVRVALAAVGCPLGKYTAAYLADAGMKSISEERVIRAENSRGVVTAVRSNRADIGVVYASDAIRAEGCRQIARIDKLPLPIRYEAAVLGAGSDDSPSASLLQFLTSQSAATRFRECGFNLPAEHKEN